MHMQFSKGDRVRVKRSTAWSEAGATGTVVQLDKSMARVTFDNAYPGTWWAMPSEIEKVEEAKPTKPTPFSKGDRVRVKMAAWFHPGDTGTVQWCGESTVRVAFDSPQEEVGEYSLARVEKIEEAKPAKPTPFSKGDRVHIKETSNVCAGDLGTVKDFREAAVWVILDDVNGGTWWYSVADVEKVEDAKPTDSIQVDNVVNHPPHYTGFSNGAEVIDITENLPFNRGNAIKYLARAGKKNAGRELEDLKKALWYVAREIERMEKSETKEEAK